MKINKAIKFILSISMSFLFIGCGGGSVVTITDDIFDSNRDNITIPRATEDELITDINKVPTVNSELHVTNIKQILSINENFKEDSFLATDSAGNDITSRVKITSTVDNSQEGNYPVLFELVDEKGQVIRRVRVMVKVQKKVIDKQDKKAEMLLKGQNKVSLFVTENYTEPGYIARDQEDGDITSAVEITVEKL